MEKILTIVIPTYNMQDYLRRCLDSLIVPEEQMEELEVLVVNDGSKDNSSAIAHEYQDKYPDTFRVIDKENGNYGSCVNRGLKEATGKYIKILDADDRYDTMVLASVLRLLQDLDVDLFITDFAFENMDSVVTPTAPKQLPQRQIFSFDQEYSQLVKCDIPMFSITYKTINVKRMGYHQTEGISYTDTEWAFLPMSSVKRVYYYPHVLYKYLKGREGQTVEGITYLKRTPQRMQICLRLINELNELNKSSCKIQAKYIAQKVKGLISEIYRILIIENPKMFDKKVLKEFDLKFESLGNQLYEETSSETIKPYFPYPFIKVWRNGDGHIPLPVVLFTKLKKIIKK